MKSFPIFGLYGMMKKRIGYINLDPIKNDTIQKVILTYSIYPKKVLTFRNT